MMLFTRLLNVTSLQTLKSILKQIFKRHRTTSSAIFFKVSVVGILTSKQLLKQDRRSLKWGTTLRSSPSGKELYEGRDAYSSMAVANITETSVK